MQITKSKVEYTELEITLTAEQVQEILATSIRQDHNIEIKASDVQFLMEAADDTRGIPLVFCGASARFLKRGRAHQVRKPGRPRKKAVPEANGEVEEEHKPKFKEPRLSPESRKKLKKIKKQAEEEDDD